MSCYILLLFIYCFSIIAIVIFCEAFLFYISTAHKKKNKETSYKIQLMSKVNNNFEFMDIIQLMTALNNVCSTIA